MNQTNLGKLPHLCALQIQAVYDTLKTAERNAADFLIAQPDEIHNLNIIAFGEAAHCSVATVVRLSKKLGYVGYPELKKDFKQHAASGRGVEYKNIKPEDDELSVMGKVFDSAVSAIQDTRDILDRDEYVKAVSALEGATKVVFCGLGDAGIVALEAHQRFVRIGVESHAAVDSDLQLILASMLGKHDVLIAFSHSGKSKTIINVAQLAHENGATVVAITNYPLSPLAKKSDVILQTAVFSHASTGEVISKRLTALCIVESLYINYLLKKGAPAIKNLERSNNSVKCNKE